MSDDNVVQFDGVTYNDIPAEKVLDGAKELEPQHALVVSFKQVADAPGRKAVTVASTTGDVPLMLYLLEVAKQRIMEEHE